MNISLEREKSGRTGESMKYLYWRGNSLWCRFPVEGKQKRYPLDIFTTGSKTDIARCERLGEQKLAEIRVGIPKTALIESMKEEAKEAPYNTNFCTLALLYWYWGLRNKKSGMNERFHLAHSVKHFGTKLVRDIKKSDVRIWLEDMKKAGDEVNTINNRFAYLRRVFSYANTEEDDPECVLNYDPTAGMSKLSGGKIRTFLLTPDKFERNYQYLLTGEKWKVKPNKHCSAYKVPPAPRFAMFYLLCWETGRRPDEAAQYTWEMVNEVEMDGQKVRFFSVPPEIAKISAYDNVVISDRLWAEMKQLGYRQGFVCRNMDGERWQNWSRYKAALQRKYGADAGWIRDTRRGFVTRKIVSEGHAEHNVMKQSGHRTRDTVKRYRIDQLRDQVSVMQSRQNNFNQAANFR